jgi:hypothetical protein
MKVWSLRRILAAVLISAAACACGEQGRPAAGIPQATTANSQVTVDLGDIKNAIASATGFSKDALELLASPAHLRIVVSDNTLAHSNQMERENAANTIVSATEQAMSSRSQFAAVQVISVAIMSARFGLWAP